MLSTRVCIIALLSITLCSMAASQDCDALLMKKRLAGRKSPMKAATVLALVLSSAAAPGASAVALQVRGIRARSRNAVVESRSFGSRCPLRIGRWSDANKSPLGKPESAAKSKTTTYFVEEQARALTRQGRREGRRRLRRAFFGLLRLRIGAVFANLMLRTPKEYYYRNIGSVLATPEASNAILLTTLLSADYVVGMFSSEGLLANPKFQQWLGVAYMVSYNIIPTLTKLDRCAHRRKAGIERWLLDKANFPLAKQLLFAHKHLGFDMLVSHLTHAGDNTSAAGAAARRCKYNYSDNGEEEDWDFVKCVMHAF